MRRSLRLSMKNLNYESPLTNLQQRQKGKREIDEESSRSRPAKRQKLNSQGRNNSVIIINDENDMGSETSTSDAGIEVVPDDSIVIVEEWPAPLAEKSKKSDDITVVWSSVPVAEKKKNYVIPYKINQTTNQKMLKGDYPQKWLGEWLAEKQNEKLPSNIVNWSKTERRNREQLKMQKLSNSKQRAQMMIEKAEAAEREKIRKNEEKLKREKMEREKMERERMEKERMEKERIEREKMEREKVERAKMERERMEREKMERAKMERERMEREKLERAKNRAKADLIALQKLTKKTTTEKADIIDISKNPETSKGTNENLREIIIDGPNVAFAYTRGRCFSEVGLKIVIDYFKNRGHKVTAFIPQHVRSRSRELLEELNRIGDVVFTPSRKAGSKVITPYDDRYILEYATARGGIIISNDQYKDLYAEKPEWRDTIEKRILPPTFVGDVLMFPDDPLGRRGPKLATFLRHTT